MSRYLMLCVLAAALWAGPVTMTVNRDAVVIPPMINYQGKLADPAGNPINGTRDMGFKLYAESTGGTAGGAPSCPA